MNGKMNFNVSAGILLASNDTVGKSAMQSRVLFDTFTLVKLSYKM